MSFVHESVRMIATPLILDGHTATSIINQFGVTKRTADRWIAKAKEA